MQVYGIGPAILKPPMPDKLTIVVTAEDRQKLIRTRKGKIAFVERKFADIGADPRWYEFVSDWTDWSGSRICNFRKRKTRAA